MPDTFGSVVHFLLQNVLYISETKEIFCNFEESCAFENDWTARERWTYAVQRKTKWDSTLNLGVSI